MEVPEGPGYEVYSSLRDEIHLRMGQQLKCVELSILFSLGLGAATVALATSQWFTEQLGKGSAGPYALIALTLVLYSLLQDALLAAYVYQTWIIRLIVAYTIAATRTTDDEPSFDAGQWERVGWRDLRGTPAAWRPGPVPWVINLFQCGIPYLSALLGSAGAA